MKHSKNILTFLAGVIFGLLLFLIIDRIDTLQNGELIDLIAIIVNIIIGAAIVLLIQKKFSDDRGVKDYFIKEIENLSIDYKKFRDGLYNEKYNGIYLLDWFKQTSKKIITIEYFLKNDLQIEEGSLQKSNREIHKLITDSNEFNDSLSRKDVKIKLSSKTKSALVDQSKNFKHSILSTIIRINRA